MGLRLVFVSGGGSPWFNFNWSFNWPAAAAAAAAAVAGAARRRRRQWRVRLRRADLCASMMFKHSVTLVNVTNMMSEVIEIGGLSILSRGTGL